MSSGPCGPLVNSSKARKLDVKSNGVVDCGAEGAAGTEGLLESPFIFKDISVSFAGQSDVKNVEKEVEAGESNEEAVNEDALEGLRS
jgi:hypothetical protein